MSIDARIRELDRRHRSLETELRDALAHPSSEDIAIREIKRRKLRIKEEIEALRSRARPAA
ncbi:MAG: YdcH family protein [Phenylobacterium sp.]